MGIIMNKLYMAALLSFNVLHLVAMDHANKIFKEMNNVWINNNWKHDYRSYSAYTPLGQKLHARQNKKTNDIQIIIKNIDNTKIILNNLLQPGESEQIFNFLKYLFEQKNQVRSGSEDIGIIKGNEEVEPQEMPKDFNKTALDAYLEMLAEADGLSI